MAKLYRVRPGESFRDGDTLKTGGDVIQLDDDMAKLHAHRVDEVPAEELPALDQALDASAPAARE